MKFIKLLKVLDQLASALASVMEHSAWNMVELASAQASIGKHSAWSILILVCVSLGWINEFITMLKVFDRSDC